MFPLTFGTELRFSFLYDPEITGGLLFGECQIIIDIIDEDTSRFRLLKVKLVKENIDNWVIQDSMNETAWVNYEKGRAILTNLITGENQVKLVVGGEKFQLYVNSILYEAVVLVNRLEYFEYLKIWFDETSCLTPIADTIFLIHHSDKGLVKYKTFI